MPSKELVVSQNRHETRVAILEDGQLVEVYFQRENEYSLAGSIHKGRVTRVLPGMQSAFVDLGLERDTFLYVSDFFEEQDEDIDPVTEKPVRDVSRRSAPVLALPVVAAPEPTLLVEPNTGLAEAEPVTPPSTKSEEAGQAGGKGEDHRDRRGRRSRRRRRNSRGFPESKYAASTGSEEQVEAGPESPEEPEAAEPVDDFILLPGESLSRYRGVTSAPVVRPAAKTDPESLREEALSAEPVAEITEETLDEILDRVEQAQKDAPGLEDEIVGSPSVADLDEDEEEEEEEPEVPPVIDRADALWEAISDPDEEPEFEGPELQAASPELDAEAPLDIDDESDLEAVDDASSSEVETDDADAAELESEEAVPEPAATAEGGADEVEPARMPQSLTATLRAQGGRFPHRGSRRMRRRGRGGRGDRETQAGAPAAETTETPLAPTERVETVERPAATAERTERPERSQRGDRRDRGDRSDSGDRGDRGDRTERTERSDRPPLPSITDLLKEGQEIIVQIAKEPLGQKGARITSHIALPGRYVVYMPTVEHLGVSRKIGSDEERQRLKRILQKHREGVVGGYIMRTAGEGKTEEDIASDMQYLANLWLDIRQKAEKRRAPALLHHDVQIVQRLLRDQLTEGFKAVWVDNEDLYQQVLAAVERMQPSLLNRIKFYTRPEPIFDAFGITQELEKGIRPKVWLKSGGYIVINQTEALVAIDVNTGKFVGKSNRLEDTIVKTNLEAVKEIVRQMRLRDLGGIIVVDFIDMEDRKNRQKVMQSLEETMRTDKAPYKILQFNDFGLVAITRKRVKQSLEKALCSPCPYCEGAGYVKSVNTVMSEILTLALKYARVVDGAEVVLRVNPDVAKILKSTENKFLEELEEILGRPVLVTSDPLLHQEKFDLT